MRFLLASLFALGALLGVSASAAAPAAGDAPRVLTAREVRTKGHSFENDGEAQPWWPEGHPNRRQMKAKAAGPPGSGHQLANATWSYNPLDDANYGPEQWYVYQPVCGGAAQSPIDINTDSVVYDDTLPNLVLNFAPFVNYSIVNNGHAIQVNENPAATPSTFTAANGETYTFSQFHFHTNSEHTINGGLGAAEMHLVFVNPNYAYPDPRQLAVIGVIFKVGNDHPGLDTITTLLSTGNLQVESSVADVLPLFDISLIIPPNPQYFTYTGSLTTPSSGSTPVPSSVPSGDASYPGCAETVTWHVLTEFQQASLTQIAELHNALYANQQPYGLTNRPVQPVNGRVIRTNVAPPTTPSCPSCPSCPSQAGGAASTVNINFANTFAGFQL